MLGEFMAARKTAANAEKPAKKTAKKKADRKIAEYILRARLFDGPWFDQLRYGSS
jgi:hypothetical protein